MKTKICTGCKKELEATTENFHKEKSGRLGLRSKCKACVRKYYQEKKEEIIERQAKYYQENKVAIADFQREYYQENKEKISKYQQENKEAIAEQKRKYYEENKEAIIEQQRKYQEQNKESILEQKSRYRNTLAPHYIAAILGIPTAEMPQEIYETKRLIVQLRREIRK